MSRILLIVLTLTVCILGCKEEEILRPLACIEETNKKPQVGIPFSFENCSNNAESYKWHFSSNTIRSEIVSYEINPTVVFESYGEYEITLTAYSDNDSTVDRKTININDNIGRYIDLDCESYSEWQRAQSNNDKTFLASSKTNASNGYNHLKIYEFDIQNNLISSEEYDIGAPGISHFLLTESENKLINSVHGVRLITESGSLPVLGRSGAYNFLLNSQYVQDNYIHTGVKDNGLRIAEHDQYGIVKIDTTLFYNGYRVEGYHVQKTGLEYYIICNKIDLITEASKIVVQRYDDNFNLINENIIQNDLHVESAISNNESIFVLTNNKILKLDLNYQLIGETEAHASNLFVLESGLILAGGIIEKYSLDLEFEWKRNFNLRDFEVVENPNGDLFILGNKYSCQDNSTDIYTVVLNADGEITK